MRITNKNHRLYLKQVLDYYPVINPHRLQKGTNIALPSQEDIKAAKAWVDSNQK